MAEKRGLGGRSLTKRELHMMAMGDLLLLGASYGIFGVRKDLLVEEIFKKQDPYRWWDALRRLRTLPAFGRSSDDFVTSHAERELELAPGTATAEDLEEFWGLVGTGIVKGAATLDVPLTRCEILVELGKHKDYRGLEPHQIEDEISKEIPTTPELSAILQSLGGPSSRSPCSTDYDSAAAYRRLRKTARFRGWSNREISVSLEETFESPDETLVARGFDHWKRKRSTPWKVANAEGEADIDKYLREAFGERFGPIASSHPSDSPRELLKKLGRKKEFRGMTDQEVLEKVEGMVLTKFAEVEDLKRILEGRRLGRAPEDAPSLPGRPQRGRSWWDAMRRYRTLKWGGNLSDAKIEKEVANGIGILPRDVTADDLSWAYEAKRPYGMREEAQTLRELSGREVLYELAKFPRYDGMGPREIAAGDGDEKLRERLRKLGGPSSSHPRKPEDW